MTKQTIVVSKNGDADFTTLQDAILSIDDNHLETVTILVKPGIYVEKVFIRKENIRILGEDCLTTIFRYNDGAKTPRPDGSEYGTFNTATVLFAGSNIEVENITFENSAGIGRIAGQALATYIASDRTSFYHCRFLGYQDTIFTADSNALHMDRLMLPEWFKNSIVPIEHPNTRLYFEDCYICGDVDYIFGPSTAYFNHCEIFTRKLESENDSFITAASTPASQEYGYVFNECNLTSDGRENSVYLGRPWRDYAKTAFIKCHMENHIKSIGWHNWNKVNAAVTTSYVEFSNVGLGATPSLRTSFSKQLDNEGLLEYYSVKSVFADNDNWNPSRNLTL